MFLKHPKYKLPNTSPKSLKMSLRQDPQAVSLVREISLCKNTHLREPVLKTPRGIQHGEDLAQRKRTEPNVIQYVI